MDKYLRDYAEPMIAALDGLRDEPHWENVVVIPACNEEPAFLRSPPPSGGRSLMILVINESPAAARVVSMRNRSLAEAVQTRFVPVWQAAADQGLSLWRDPLASRDVLLLDRFSAGRQLPAGGGVGLARKTGADLALSLIRQQRVRSRWIHCSDADVQLPETYFSCVAGLADGARDHSALVYPFSHVAAGSGGADDSLVFMATQLYELALRYYVAGLRFARSPYAYHTIGSSMAVNALHYAKVRGFPRREAGEDFYLLNKLAKVGPVLELAAGPDCAAIAITSRRSDRVPFGTGAAVNRITALADPLGGYGFYHPAVFGLLKSWLESLPAIWRSGSTDLTVGLLTGQADDHRQKERQRVLIEILRTMRTEQALEHAFRQSNDFGQFTRQLHTWFDAFRTLKLIHALRDTCLPCVSYAGLQADPAFRILLTTDPDLSAFHQRLPTLPVGGSLHNERQPRCGSHTNKDTVEDICNA